MKKKIICTLICLTLITTTLVGLVGTVAADLPEEPGRPRGPGKAAVYEECMYSIDGVIAEKDHDVLYLFDWDDGTNSSWLGPFPPGEGPINASHSWDAFGKYKVKVKARDNTTGNESEFSRSKTVKITPLVPAGPQDKIVTNILCEFSAEGISPLNETHDVLYKFKWDDGSQSDWLGPFPSGDGPIIVNHSYEADGNYNIRVKAKDNTTGYISDWSGPLNIAVSLGPMLEGPVNKIMTNIKNEFSVEGINAIDDHELLYFFDWGDGTTSSWLGPYDPLEGPIEAIHGWNTTGDFNIRAQVKDNTTGDISEFSLPLRILVQSGPAPSGPLEGEINVINFLYTFSVEGVVAISGHELYYLFDWGDGTNSSWLGPYEPLEGPIEAITKWTSTGKYQVKVKVKDETTGDESNFSKPMNVSILSGPPISGPSEANAGELCKFKVTVDTLEDHEILYWFDWGDDTKTGWIGPIPAGQKLKAEHSYSELGEYDIRVKARDTATGEETEFSDKHVLAVIHPRPHFEITQISGGFGVKVGIKNLLPTSKHVDYSIEIAGGPVSGLHVNKLYEGTIHVKSGTTELIDTGIFFALGRVKITVTAKCAGEEVIKETAYARVLVIYVLMQR